MAIEHLQPLIDAIRAHQANPLFSTKLLLISVNGRFAPTRSHVELRINQALIEHVDRARELLRKFPTASSATHFAAKWMLTPPDLDAVTNPRVECSEKGICLTAKASDGSDLASEIVPYHRFDKWLGRTE